MAVLQLLLYELSITARDPAVWLAIGLALVIGAGLLVFGLFVGRLVGLPRPGAPMSEVLGVGLSIGLVIAVAWWAAIRSGGSSTFAPVAIGFAVAALAAVVRRSRRGVGADAPAKRQHPEPHLGRLALIALSSAGFVAATAILYGATLAPSARDGVQPVEFNDIAFYAVLGRDLAATGTEDILSMTGFPEADGLADQSWYHWGELWLASAIIQTTGIDAMAARYFIALPLILLAAASLMGSVVRRLTGSESTTVFAFGFVACLLLAPFALASQPFFASWASGMLFGVNLYGLAVPAVLLVLYTFAVVRDALVGWPTAIFIGSVVAFVLPAHLAVALLGLVGLATVFLIRLARWLTGGRRERLVGAAWMRIWVVALVLALGTIVWGLETGHSLGGAGGSTDATALVPPFNASWQTSVAATTLGAGALLAIALAIPVVWRTDQLLTDLFLGALTLVAAGAFGWGARVADFTMFYLFFAGIAVIATPVAVVAIYVLWSHLREKGNRRLALVLVVLCAIQIEAGVPNAVGRLQSFGANAPTPIPISPIPLSVLSAIRALPGGARIAYHCDPLEESSFGVPRLGSIDVHAGRRIIPVCFNAELLSSLNGAPRAGDVPNLYFAAVPQRELFPDVDSDPSTEVVERWLREHGITHLYVDDKHPPLIPGAIPIVTDGVSQILRLP